MFFCLLICFKKIFIIVCSLFFSCFIALSLVSSYFVGFLVYCCTFFRLCSVCCFLLCFLLLFLPFQQNHLVFSDWDPLPPLLFNLHDLHSASQTHRSFLEDEANHPKVLSFLEATKGNTMTPPFALLKEVCYAEFLEPSMMDPLIYMESQTKNFDDRIKVVETARPALRMCSDMDSRHLEDSKGNKNISKEQNGKQPSQMHL